MSEQDATKSVCQELQLSVCIIGGSANWTSAAYGAEKRKNISELGSALFIQLHKINADANALGAMVNTADLMLADDLVKRIKQFGMSNQLTDLQKHCKIISLAAQHSKISTL